MNTSDSLLNFAVLPSLVQTTTVITPRLWSCCVPPVGMRSKKPDEVGGGEKEDCPIQNRAQQILLSQK